MQINVGDKVVVNLDYDAVIKKGMTGIYHGKDSSGTGLHVVEFDKFSSGHTGSGAVPNSVSCWFIDFKFLTHGDEPIVGDRVECIQTYTRPYGKDNVLVGMQGELKKIDGSDYYVKWDNYTAGHDGGLESGSKAYLIVEKHHIKKVGIAIPEPEPEKPFFNIFDTSDVFKPEVMQRIWENTMGRPVEYPKLPPLPKEEDDPVAKIVMDDVVILDIPLEEGRECICVDAGSNINYCDRAVYKGIDGSYGSFVMTYSQGSAHPVGKTISCFSRRFKHFRLKDEYFFAKPKRYTREMIDRMWQATQELSRH